MLKRIFSLFAVMGIIFSLTPGLSYADEAITIANEKVGTMFETGKVYLGDSWKSPTANEGDFTFQVTADPSNPSDDPINGSMTFTNGSKGSINFWSGLQWPKYNGTYKYTLSCIACNIDGWEIPTEVYSFAVYTDNITSWGAYAESAHVPDNGYKNCSLYFFANEKLPDYNPEPIPPVLEEIQIYGSLTIQKEITTTQQNLYDYFEKNTDEFTFEITIGEKVETITLKAGESYTIEDILLNTAGIEYSIEEINIPDGYAVNGDNPIIGTLTVDNKNHTVTFTNIWSYNFSVTPGPFPEFTVDPEVPGDSWYPQPGPNFRPKPPVCPSQQYFPCKKAKPCTITNQNIVKENITTYSSVPKTGDNNIIIIASIIAIGGISLLLVIYAARKRKYDSRVL